MQRRKAIKNTSLLIGGLLAVPGLGILTGFSSNPHDHHHARSVLVKPAGDIPFAPKALSSAQNECLIAATERLIPTTDTPGAKEARVNEYIDRLLAQWMKEDEKNRFLAGLEGLDRRAQTKYQKSFEALQESEQDELLQFYAQSATAGNSEEGRFFRELKALTLEGYYTSEIGATQELQYSASHGTYVADAPLSQIGRAWA
ncbi:MAG: gluconate 2-dehydrogenase subunit 3 family protein [Rhodothermia bacterium]|nr:gluconate 2-dehydrogenase subunit 3 family protein [Rhodothermia bacterium]